jgi:hypothetical protein
MRTCHRLRWSFYLPKRLRYAIKCRLLLTLIPGRLRNWGNKGKLLDLFRNIAGPRCAYVLPDNNQRQPNRVMHCMEEFAGSLGEWMDGGFAGVRKGRNISGNHHFLPIYPKSIVLARPSIRRCKRSTIRRSTPSTTSLADKTGISPWPCGAVTLARSQLRHVRHVRSKSRGHRSIAPPE